MKQEIVGSFEPVILPEFGETAVVAKIDTGAYSGAVHCSDIQIIEQGDIKKLSFRPYAKPDLMIETTHFSVSRVRSSTGHEVKRYLIETPIIINNKQYIITIGLFDRSSMKFEVLIGRRFLRKYNLIVDARINQDLDPDVGKADK